jgi:hypothetical protein
LIVRPIKSEENMADGRKKKKEKKWTTLSKAVRPDVSCLFICEFREPCVRDDKGRVKRIGRDRPSRRHWPAGLGRISQSLSLSYGPANPKPPLLYLSCPLFSPRWCCTFHVITQKQTKNKVMGSRQKLGRPAIGRRRTTTAATTNKMELGRYSIFYRRVATVRIAVLMDRLPFLLHFSGKKKNGRQRVT